MSLTVVSEPRGPLHGVVEVPGDKSVSHRALMLGSLASGPSRISGLLRSGDVDATAGAMRALGAEIVADGPDFVLTPPRRLAEPDGPIDCGNSGTTIRLLSGLLVGEGLSATLTGDASLSRRPMARVVDPLTRMGASIAATDGKPPLVLHPSELIPDTRHALKIASAQVKSCLLLAGRRVGVWVREPSQSRDHTERMLRAMGANLEEDMGGLRLHPTPVLHPLDVQVPRDLSAAAFWMVAAAITPHSEIELPRIGMNPTRAGVLDALRRMGARIEVHPVDAPGAEPIADLKVHSSPLIGTEIAGELALRCLDELPILAVAAAFAEGSTMIRDAAELRVKESDRISRVVGGLRTLGVEVEELPDGMIVHGGHPAGPGHVDAHGDHRIAMAFAVAGSACQGGVTIDNADSVSSSYPAFFETLAALGA